MIWCPPPLAPSSGRRRAPAPGRPSGAAPGLGWTLLLAVVLLGCPTSPSSRSSSAEAEPAAGAQAGTRTDRGGDGEGDDSETPRVASLVPVVTETLIALDRADLLVAVSDYGPLPLPSGRRPPRAGTGLTPSFETLARVAPTLIVTERAAGIREAALARIAPTMILPWRTVDEAAASIRRLGAAADAVPAAEALARRFEQELAAAAAATPEKAPRVLAVLAAGADDRLKSLWYVRADSLHGTALEAAGARNAIPDPPSGAPELGLEALVRLDPPAILVLGESPADAARTRAQLEALSVLAAVRQGRLAVVAGPAVLHTGPTLLELVPRIRAALEER